MLQSCIRVYVLISLVSCWTLQHAGATRCRQAGQELHDSVEVFEGALIVDLVMTLQWPAVTVISGTSEAKDLNFILEAIQERRLPMAVYEGHGQNISRAGFHLENSDRILVLGDYEFIEDTFRKVRSAALAVDRASLLFDTEWITVLDEQFVLRLENTITWFENVAAIVRQETGALSLWTLRHVRDDSQLSLVSTLPPPAPPLTRHHILPNIQHGLGGRTLRIVVKETRYYVSSVTVNGVRVYQGVLMDLLQELSLRLNFSYTLVNLTDDSWGQELDNGQWDGPIGMLTRKEVDMAVSLFTQTPGRSSVADPTTPALYDNAILIYSKTAPTTNALSFYLQPFQTPVYVAVVGCLAGVLLLLLLTQKYQRWTGRCHSVPEETGEVLQTMMTNTEILLAGLVKEPHIPLDKIQTSRASHVLWWAWLMFGLILASVYSSKLTSSLAVSDQALPFTSLSQLVNQDTYTWGVHSGTADEQILKTSTDPDFRLFYEGAVREARQDPDVLSPDVDVHKRKLFSGGYAYFAPSTDVYYTWSAESCNLAMLPERYRMSAFGFYLQKGSPYTRLLSEEISRMTDAGLVDYWRRKWKPPKKQCDPDEGESNRVIVLTQVQTGFYLAMCGIGLGGLTLMMELLLSRCT